jgi:hypothetical protein
LNVDLSSHFAELKISKLRSAISLVGVIKSLSAC